ncbi:hypothetical protein, partial [Salmonella enterica]|uniref:hypothetical protein n=1 Tax=Salmonella enterica TaxID=28901 RepID=UPI000647FD4C
TLTFSSVKRANTDPFPGGHPPRLRTFPAFLTAYGMFLNPAFFLRSACFLYAPTSDFKIVIYI